MGYGLKIGSREINSKSVAYPMGNIIRDILPDVEETDVGWKLKKKHIAELASFTGILLEEDDALKYYINEHKDFYGFDDNFEEVKENIQFIHICLTNTLIDMVLFKDKCVKVKWI